MEAQPELLAQHYTEARFLQQAMAYWHQAGQRASGRSAHVEAVAHLTKGLEVLQMLPETTERTQRELAFQVSLGRGFTTMTQEGRRYEGNGNTVDVVGIVAMASSALGSTHHVNCDVPGQTITKALRAQPGDTLQSGARVKKQSRLSQTD